MEDLKPCFRCSSALATVYHWKQEKTYSVACQKCGATTGGKKTRYQAVKAWNRRQGDE